MSNVLILSPLALDAGDLLSSSSALNFPVGNLSNPQPKIVWKAASSGQVYVDIDLQSNQSVDSFFLGFTNAGSSVHWDIRTSTSAEGRAGLASPSNIRKPAGPILATLPENGQRPHAFWTGPSIIARHIRMNITNSTTPFSAGVVSVGKAFRPRYNYDWGAGRSLTDLSVTKNLRGGQMDVFKDAIIPTWRFTLGNLDDGELEALWKEEHSLAAFTADDQFKSYEDLKLRLETTLKGNYSKPVDEEVFEEEAELPTPVATTAPSAAPETDTLSYFAKLAQDD